MSDIADAIKYFADNMKTATINQSVNCGCGGGGGGGGGDTVLDEPVTQPEDEPVDIVPPVPDATESALTPQERCNLGHYLADSWVNTFVDIDTVWGGLAVTITSVMTWLTEKFPPGALLPFIAMIVSSLIVAIEAALLAGLSGNMSDAAQSHHDDIICAVYGAATPQDAKKRFESVIANSRSQYGKITYAVLILVAQMLDWNKIMGGEVIVPAEYDNSDCTGCAPPNPVGFQFVPATVTAVEPFGGTGVSNMVGSIIGGEATSMTFDASSGGRTARLDHTFQSRPALQPGEEWIGFIYQPENIANMNSAGYSFAWPTDTANAFCQANHPVGIVAGVTRVHVLPGKSFPTTWLDWVIGETPSMSFESNRVKAGLVGQSGAAGSCEMQHGHFYWIKKLA